MNRDKIMKRILFILLIALTPLWSQSFDGTGLGLAGSYTVTSRGIDALSWNPANIALPRGNTLEINIASANIALLNNAFSMNTYNRYFTHEGNPDTLLDSGEKRDFLNLIPENYWRLNTDVSANVLGLAFNNFAMGMQVISQGGIGFNKKPLEIGLYGENITTDYQLQIPEQVQGSAYAAVKISFGYAYPFRLQQFFPKLDARIQPVSVGIAVNYYLGIAVAEVQDSEILLHRFPAANDQDETIKYGGKAAVRVAIPEEGMIPGRGRGFDFGIASGYGSQLRFGIGFSNLGASINWNYNTRMELHTISDSLKTADLIENGPETATRTDTTMDIDAFSTPLPSVMRVGAAYYLKPEWLVMAEWQQGLNKAFGNSTTPRISVATEYKVTQFFPVRAGIALGGKESFLFSLGFGLHLAVFDLDYSFAMKNALWPTHSEGLFQAVGMKFKL